MYIIENNRKIIVKLDIFTYIPIKIDNLLEVVHTNFQRLRKILQAITPHVLMLMKLQRGKRKLQY